MIPLDEVRRRYDALGPIREYAGERTFAGRCHSFPMFLEYGQVFVELVEETWPTG